MGPDHALGLVQDDLRLVAAGGSRLDLGGGVLLVGDQEVEGQSSHEGALPLLAEALPEVVDSAFGVLT
jgi:hypothetical protein